MANDQNDSVLSIKDKLDTESANAIVGLGYPENADHMSELLFWSCFPNDPVCFVTFPYIHSLKDEELAPHLAEFLEYHFKVKQEDLVGHGFFLFVNARTVEFREQVRSHVKAKEVLKLFDEEKHSFERAQELYKT